MGIFKESRGRVKGCMLLGNEVTHFLTWAEVKLAQIETDLTENIGRSQQSVQDFFQDSEREISELKDLVFTYNILESGSRLIIDTGSPSMKGTASIARGKLLMFQKSVVEMTEKVKESAITHNLVKGANSPDSDQFVFKLIYIGMEDWNSRQRDYAARWVEILKDFN